jgi:hypothetical protein
MILEICCDPSERNISAFKEVYLLTCKAEYSAKINRQSEELIHLRI